MSLLCKSIVYTMHMMTVHCVHVLCIRLCTDQLASTSVTVSMCVCTYHMSCCVRMFVIHCMHRLETGSSDKQSLLVHSDCVLAASKYIRRIMTQLNMRYVHFKCSFHITAHFCSCADCTCAWTFRTYIMFVSQVGVHYNIIVRAINFY